MSTTKNRVAAQREQEVDDAVGRFWAAWDGLTARGTTLPPEEFSELLEDTIALGEVMQRATARALREV